jgi:hypothetical protein
MLIRKIKLLIFLIITFHSLILAQKKKEHISSSINMSIGMPFKQYKTDSSAASERHLNLEYQIYKKRKSLSIGFQFNYTNGYFIVDTNIYTLLVQRCPPNTSIISGNYYCRYSSKYNMLNVNIPIYYNYDFFKSNKVNLFVKAGVIIKFIVRQHYLDKVPLLDSKNGVLLDPGPFDAEYNINRIEKQGYDLCLGTSMNYKLTKKIDITGTVQFQKKYQTLFPPQTFGFKIERGFMMLGTRIHL